MEKKQTAAMQLFGLLNSMSKIMKDAGDEHYSNMLKHICDEYVGLTIKTEKEQIMDAFVECWKSNIPEGIECKLSATEYYYKTYGNAN